MKIKRMLKCTNCFPVVGILIILVLTIKSFHSVRFDMTNVDKASTLSEKNTDKEHLGQVLLEQEGQALLEQKGQVLLEQRCQVLLEQRNNLSKLLNLKQQQIGQRDCKLKKSISDTGGWCKNQSKENSGKHMTDKQLVPKLAQFLKGKYIGSFGDGPGRYKQLIADSGQVKGYDAYDGAPFCDVTSNGRVMFLDLTLPQYGLPLYDWILSFEVAEHIPRRFESVYIDNIVRHAREGVILSWARIGQAGYSHVNNRPFEYVKDLMKSLGFIHDLEASDMLRSAARFRHLKRNLNVYRRNQSVSSKVLMLQT